MLPLERSRLPVDLVQNDEHDDVSFRPGCCLGSFDILWIEHDLQVTTLGRAGVHGSRVKPQVHEIPLSKILYPQAVIECYYSKSKYYQLQA